MSQHDEMAKLQGMLVRGLNGLVDVGDARIARLELELAEANRRAEEAEDAKHKLEIEAERLAQENANLLSRAEEAEGAVKVLAESHAAVTEALGVNAYMEKAYAPEQCAARARAARASEAVHANRVAVAALAATVRKEGT